MRYQITCVNKINGVIVSVGCSNGSRFTEQQVITKIGNGDTFYTNDPFLNKTAEVEIWQWKSNGKEFIKTAADCTVNNNLDNLPLCP
jgi:hypothetical protein